jgi:hypothetical protein
MSNGSSYQQFDGQTGVYQEVGNGSPRRRFTEPLFAVGAVAAVALAVYYGMFALHRNPQDAVDKQLSINKNVKVNANGKLRLFDELSKYEGEDSWTNCLVKRNFA